MKFKKNNNNIIFNKNCVTKARKKLIHKKTDRKEGFSKKDFKSIKINDTALYTLRNKKIIEKKNFNKRKRRIENKFMKGRVPKFSHLINATLTTGTGKFKSNDDTHKVINEINSSMSPSKNEKIAIPGSTSISFTRTFVDPSSKLKILDLYYQLDSFDEASKLTGVHSQTIRYWKKTEDSIKEKVQQDPEWRNNSSSQIDLETMITEVKNSLKRSLSKNTTTIKSVTRKFRLKSPSKSGSPTAPENKSINKTTKHKSTSNKEKSSKPRKSRIKKSDSSEFRRSSEKSMRSMDNGINKIKNKKTQQQSHPETFNNSSSQLDFESLYTDVKNSLKQPESKTKTTKKSGKQKFSLKSTVNCNSQISSPDRSTDEMAKHKTKLNEEKLNNSKPTNSDSTNLRYMPNLESIEAIVDEINKLSNVFESGDCLESLHNHFQILQSEHGNKITFHNSLLLAKTKLQDETFKHIMVDFFEGEYKLLMEINHQFQQLKQKKSKNINKNLENLRNYFNGSMHRLLVLKHQLT